MIEKFRDTATPYLLEGDGVRVAESNSPNSLSALKWYVFGRNIAAAEAGEGFLLRDSQQHHPRLLAVTAQKHVHSERPPRNKAHAGRRHCARN